MNTNTVTDGQLGQLAVKQNELFQRAKKGVYKSFEEVLDALQQIIEGKAPVIPMLAPVAVSAIITYAVDISPDTFIGDGWKWADADKDVRSLELREVDFSKVSLETCLSGSEVSITGEEKLRRLIAMGGVRLDPRFGVALFQEKEQNTLKRLYQDHEASHLDFFGQIFVNPYGRRCVLYLFRCARGWNWSVRWLDDEWHDRRFSACLES